MIATTKLVSVEISLVAKIELFPCAGHVAGDRCSEHLLVGFAGRVSAYGNNIGGGNCRRGAGTLFSAVPNVRTNLEA
jgi:hypothetical protein